MPDSPVEVLERWEEHGATWKVLHLSDEHAIVDLCTCSGEPVERLESGDSGLIAWLRERSPPEPHGM